MTNKLVVIIKSLKVANINKILLFEMKFLVPNYSCLQIPWLGGFHPPDPRSICPLSSTEFVDPLPPRTKFLGTPLLLYSYLVRYVRCHFTSSSWDVIMCSFTDISIYVIRYFYTSIAQATVRFILCLWFRASYYILWITNRCSYMQSILFHC